MANYENSDVNQKANSALNEEKLRVLVMMRPYLFEDFHAGFSALPDTFEVHYVTDSARRGVLDTTKVFYESLKASRRSPEIDPDTETEVIARCRLLRNLPRERACQIVHAMALSLAARIDEVRPDVMISQLIDEYVTHLFSILASKRCLPCTQIGPSYFDGLMLTTQLADGTPRNVRRPEAREAREAFEQINDVRRRRNYTLKDGYSWRRHCWQVMRYNLKRAVFWVSGRLKGDPLYVHYAILPYLAERRRLRDFPDMTLFSADWAARVDAARQKSARTVVYLPLSYSPEATIDYWIADTRMIDYEGMTVEMLRVLGADPGILLLVKDHVHMMGMRAREFYRAMATLPNVILVPPAEFGNQVLQMIDCVLLGGGSTGVEAMVHGKPVTTYCSTSYWQDPSDAALLDTVKMSGWPEQIKQAVANFKSKTDDEKCAALLVMMKASIKVGSPGRIWPVGNQKGLADMIHATYCSKIETV